MPLKHKTCMQQNELNNTVAVGFLMNKTDKFARVIKRKSRYK